MSVVDAAAKLIRDELDRLADLYHRMTGESYSHASGARRNDPNSAARDAVNAGAGSARTAGRSAGKSGSRSSAKKGGRPPWTPEQKEAARVRMQQFHSGKKAAKSEPES